MGGYLVKLLKCFVGREINAFSRDRKGEPEMQMEAEHEFKLQGGFEFSLNLIVLPRVHHQGGSRLKPERSSDSHKTRCRHQNVEMSRKRQQTLEKEAEEGAVHYHKWWRVRLCSSQARACERISNNEREQTTSDGEQHGLVWVVGEPKSFSSCFS